MTVKRPRTRGHGTGRVTRTAGHAAVLAALVAAMTGPLAGPAAAQPAGRAGASAAAAANGGCPWMDRHDSPGARARLLLDASSLGQKLRWLDEKAANTPGQTTFSGVTYPAQLPCTPTVVYSDGPDYVRGADGATVFPDQIALAASWDPALAYRKGRAQAAEAWAAGRNVLLAPGVSGSRTPLAGRTPEYLGEDPRLSGELAAADIDGMQHGNRGRPVMAVVKHYVANEQELDRQSSSSNVAARPLREVYDLPVAIAVAKAHPGGVMCSFNQVNGEWACQNPLLRTLLKGEDGFRGYVTSDFGSVHSTAPSLHAGLDQELNRPIYYAPGKVEAALKSGEITVRQIDRAAFRVIRAYIAAGLFDHPLPDQPSDSPSTPATRAVSERIAERGSVLLKNAHRVLPLTRRSGTIAVIGPTASNTPADGVSARTVCGQGGRFGPRDACQNPVAPLDAITARAARDGLAVRYDNGSDPAKAAALARSADVAIVFGYSQQGEGADRETLALDNGGDALISTVAGANPDTVAVVETGTATTMPWLAKVRGVVEAWYPGDQQGTALARLLFGDADFTGRLPMTFPRSPADTPTHTPARYPGIVPAGSAIRQVDYGEGLKVGYRWYDAEHIAPLFPFGHGLSYTRFRYSHLRVDANGHGHGHGRHENGHGHGHGRHRNGHGAVHVTFRVTNTGSRTGAATGQVYLTLPRSAGEPGRRLVAHARTRLRPGHSRTVRLTIDPGSATRPLSYWNPRRHSWTIPSGRYTLAAGPSSRDLPLHVTFTR